jgi:hypothetical protein
MATNDFDTMLASIHNGAGADIFDDVTNTATE